MDYLIPPWKHQQELFARARKHRDFALFWEMGTGKTSAQINVIREHFARNRRIMRTLILGPMIVVKNWQAEFKMHSKIPPGEIVPLIGAGKKRVAEFAAKAAAADGTLTRGKIFITNYEATEMEELLELILLWKPEILVCDESQRLKNHKAVRAKNVVRIADRAEHRYILTGTPILNSAADIFHQFRILDGGRTFSITDRFAPEGWRPMNFTEFRNAFFEDENAGMLKKKETALKYFPNWMPRPATYEELNARIYRKAMRVEKKACLDLPPLVRKKLIVPLGVDQKRMYDEMKKECLTFVKSHLDAGEPRAVVAQLALTKSLRLLQIVSGFAKTEDGVEVTLKDNPRLAELGDTLDDLVDQHKVIVWANFKENYRSIAAMLDKRAIPFVEIHGGISHSDRERNMQAFRKDPKCRVVVANQLAAGIGVNLVEASYSIFYSRNFSLEQDLQAEARNYRGGSEIHRSVTRIDLVAEDTIDEAVLQALAAKQDIAESVLAWGQREV